MAELVNNCACHKAKLLFLLKGKLERYEKGYFTQEN